MDFGLTGKIALVTAASKGLGRACALALAGEGARIALAARTREALEHTAQEIRQISGQEALAIPTDLRQPTEISALVQQTIATFGGIDILVNNAGGPPVGTFDTLSDDQWEDAFHLT
ncbi:MAG TPA: SDR family NAD(P)-dependent oxidoreductase, partial [Ktedonobacteraceae bacterium]